MSRFGFELLGDQASEYARGLVNDTSKEITGDSPIEKLLLLAMVCRSWLGTDEYMGVSPIENESDLADLGDTFKRLSIRYRQQVQIDSIGRVDFVFYAYDTRGRVLRAPGWRKLIVECDGHDFHERTKEQAKRDRSRDRKATLGGLDVMRFTGSEIWNDPWGCAGDIFDWASRGFE